MDRSPYADDAGAGAAASAASSGGTTRSVSSPTAAFTAGAATGAPIAAPAATSSQHQLKPSIAAWKGLFSARANTGSPAPATPTTMAGGGGSGRSAVTSPVPPQQQQQQGSLVGHTATPSPSNSQRNSRSDIKIDFDRRSQFGSLSSPLHMGMRPSSTSSPSESRSSSASFQQPPEFDRDLSAGLLFSAPPTEAQCETYLRHLWKLHTATPPKDRQARTMRRRQIEEMGKLARRCQFADLRVISDILTGLLQPMEDRALLDERHAAFDFLCVCLEAQTSIASHRPFFYSLLTSHKHQLSARLLGLSLLTNGGRSHDGIISADLAHTLVDWLGELEGIGAHLNHASAGSSALLVGSPSASTPLSSPLSSSAVTGILSVPGSESANSPVLQFLGCGPSDGPLMVHRALTTKLLVLINAFTKYHFGAMGERALCSLIARMCSKVPDESESITQSLVLPFLDTITRCGVPLAVRPRVVHALCLCVNIASRESFSCMRLLLESRDGTEILHALLESMEDLADEFMSTTSSQQVSPSLTPVRALRGGIFLVAMASWASQRLASLSYPFVVILQRFDQIMDCNHTLLVYEIALALRRLVVKYSQHLKLEWEPLLSILHKMVPQARAHAQSNLTDILAQTMTHIEEAFATRQLAVDDDEVLALLVAFKAVLTPECTSKLLGHLQQSIHPANPQWLQRLSETIDLFFHQEKNQDIQLQTLSMVDHTLTRFALLFGDAITRECVLGTLVKGGGQEESVLVRQRKLVLVAKIACELETSQFPALLGVLEASTACDVIAADEEGSHIIPEVREIRVFASSLLVSVFAASFARSDPSLMLATFDVLTKLSGHADKEVRSEAVDALMRLRATEDGRLQQADTDDTIKVESVFLLPPATLSLLSHSLLSCLVRRLRCESHVETWDRLMSGLHSLIVNYYLLDAASASAALILGLTCERAKQLIEERRTSDKKNKTLTAADVSWSPHWSTPSRALRYLHGLQALLGTACRSSPAVVEELLNALLLELDEWTSMNVAPPTTTKEKDSATNKQHSPSHRLAAPAASMLERLPIYLQCCQVVLISSTSASFTGRYVAHLFARLVRLSAMPLGALGLDSADWMRPILQCAHACSSLTYSPPATIELVRQVTTIALPVLSTATPNNALAFWSSRTIASWFVHLSLVDRQTILPVLHAGLLVPHATHQPWNPVAACLLDLVNRHGYWHATASTLHETQMIPSQLRAHSSLFPAGSAHHTWLQGLSLLTVRVGILDYHEIVIRRASGTSSWLMRSARSHSAVIHIPREHWRTPFAANPAIVVQGGLLDVDSSSPTTPHSTTSSFQPVLLSTDSSPGRYIQPSSPTSGGVSFIHAWPKIAAKQLQVSGHPPQAPTQTLTRRVKEEKAHDDLERADRQQRNADTLIIASSLVEFKLDSSPPDSSPPSTRAITPPAHTVDSSFLHMPPLLSYDVATHGIIESSPRLYSLHRQDVQRHSKARAANLLSVASAVSSESSSPTPPESRRSVGPPNEQLAVPLQPVPRRSTAPSDAVFPNMIVVPPPHSQTGASTPRRATPRTSSDTSPLLRAESAMPSPSAAHSAFSHHTSSPFRAAVKVVAAAGASRTAGNSPGRKKEGPTISVIPAIQRVALQDGVHSPSARRMRNLDRPGTADASPLHFPVPVRGRKPAPATSSLSLLTQAFSHQKATSSAVDSSTTTFSSSLLTRRGLPLTSPSTANVSAAALESMWAILGELDQEEDERKTGPRGLKGKAEMDTLTAKSHAASSLIQSIDSEQLQPAFILAQLQETFPEFESGGTRLNPSSAQWQSLSTLGSESVSVALSVLDDTSMRDTLKIGLIYVGPGQRTEAEVLQNTHGSSQYQLLLSGLGEAVSLQGERRYVGGLDRESNRDGEVAILFSDLTREVCYHIATLLPSRVALAHSQNKLRLLGNDTIIIAYLDRGGEYDVRTLSSQTTLAYIVVAPMRSDVFQVSLSYRLPELALSPAARRLPVKQLVLSSALATYLRDLCQVVDLACQQFLQQARSVQLPDASFFGNQEQRGHQITTLRNRLQSRPAPANAPVLAKSLSQPIAHNKTMSATGGIAIH